MNVLFLNHKQKQCGVYQHGFQLASIVRHSDRYNMQYAEVETAEEFERLISETQYRVVIYNWYPSTMGWASPEHADKYRGRFVQIGIFHEVLNEHFDYYIHGDPTIKDDGKTFSTGRPLMNYSGAYPESDVPIIGSFGFGLGGKGYHDIVKRVENEYDEAIIRLHISFAHFGDQDGEGAYSWAKLAQKELTKPNIQLQISHDFMDTETLLGWLAGNTLNMFLYAEMYGRGIASTIDCALSVRRPIAINNSYMFRHLLGTPSIFVENKTLKEIIANGVAPLEKYYEAWSAENLVRRYEDVLEQITSR